MADALVAAVTAYGTQQGGGPSADQPDAQPASSGVGVNLVMSDATLVGDSQDPAWVEGYGPVPADLAREIVAVTSSGPDDADGHEIETTMPTGHRYRSRPPPLARIHHHTDLPPITIDYHLAG